MTASTQRLYNCKVEELPVICNYALFSLKRDLADFTSFSPKFNAAYVTDFETKIASASEVAMPRSETLDLKNLTVRLYATMDGLIEPINRVSGYLKLAQASLTVTAADFGLTLLRKNINSKNAEGVISSLRTVSNNLNRHTAVLSGQGLTPELTGRFTDAITSIAADNQKQYEITSNRANIVQNNLGLFNSLYEQLMEILNVGKILYKTADAVKTQEYTFNSLLKQVRIVSKQAAAANPVAPA
jgi:hypothetical protein